MPPPPWWRERPVQLLLLGTLAFVVLQLAFFPSYFASIDEHEYLKNAFLLRQGTLAEPDRTASCEGKPAEGGYVSQYFLGRSLSLIPFTGLGLSGVLLSGLAIHLLNLLLFTRILRRLGRSSLYGFFYLLYPAFLWESRTLNSELLALTALLAATFFYLSAKRRDHLLAGMLFGLAALPRYEVVLLATPFLLVPLVKDRRKFLHLLAGFLPVILLLIALNSALYGGIYGGYGTELGEIFAFETGLKPFYGLTLAKFLLILAAVLPLMILAPLAAPAALRKELLFAAVIFLLFYAQNVNLTGAPWLHPTAVTGQLRYLIPLLGLLLLAYPPLYERILSRLRLPWKPVTAAVIVILFIAGAAATVVHADFLDGRKAVFDQIYAHTSSGSLLVGTGDDCNYVLNELFEERAYLDIATPGLEQWFANYSEVYLLEIRYGTADTASPRGALVTAERQAMTDYVAAHRGSLAEIFSAQEPHAVAIYRWEGG